MENLTDNDIFINIYLKKQEELTVEIIRKRLEAEVKTQLLQTELQKILAEKTSSEELLKNSAAISEELLKQSLSSLESVTVERNYYKDKFEKDSVTLIELKEQLKNSYGLKSQVSSLENDLKTLRDININNQTLLTELKAHAKEFNVIKAAYETTKNNYNIVLEELNKVTEKPLLPIKKKSNKKLPETLPESEWIDGNEIST